MKYRLAFLLILIASSVSADEWCRSSETPRQCMKRLITTRVYVTVQAALTGAKTGPGGVSSPSRSAVKDFLSAASAQIDTSSVKGRGNDLTVDYNLPGSILGDRGLVNLEVTLPNPRVSPAVAAEASSSKAPEHLNRGDDVLASLSFNPVTQHFGRSLAPHRALFDSMLLALVANATPSTTSVPPASFDTPFEQLVPDTTARMTAIAEFETTMIAAMPDVASLVTQDLARLANNQPQLFVSVLTHNVKANAGPRESGFRLTWEAGTNNINSFRRAEGRDCEAQGTCLVAYNEYTNRTTAKRNTGRLSLAIEYHKIEQNNPALTAPHVIQLGANKLTYSAIYGREFRSFAIGKPARIDLALTYDGKTTTHTQSITSGFMNQEEPLPQLLPPSTTRYSAAATVTQPLFGGLSVPFSVVWTEHTDWLPGTMIPPLLFSPPVPSFPGNGHIEPFKTTTSKVEFWIALQYKVPSRRQPSSRRPASPDCCCK